MYLLVIDSLAATRRPRSGVPIIRLLDSNHLSSLLTPITHTPHILNPSSMLQYLDQINSSGSASAQQMSSGGRLDETRNLAVNSEAFIDPYNLETVKEQLIWCVLHPKTVSKSCSTHVSADSEDVKMNFETERCLSINLQEQGYRRTVSLSGATAFLTISQIM